MTSGLSAGFEVYITEGRERTDVMTCLFLFPSRSCHSQGSKQIEKSPEEARRVTWPGRACWGVTVLVLTREDSDLVSFPPFSFKIFLRLDTGFWLLRSFQIPAGACLGQYWMWPGCSP